MPSSLEILGTAEDAESLKRKKDIVRSFSETLVVSHRLP